MKLIADSGSTKTDWCLTEEDGRVSAMYKTQGINPFHQDRETIAAVLSDELLTQIGDAVPQVTAVYFYGSGVRQELQPLMGELLREAFPQAGMVEAQGDMLGAARALCGREAGVACILGTGANSCLYDGREIVANTPPLGYILGDEGSGAVLGMRFLNALYKGFLPEGMLADFERETGLSMADVISRVYRQPMANRWLASLSTYIHRHVGVSEVEALVVDNFRQFLRRNVAPYQSACLPVSAVGSIAWHYRSQWLQALHAEGMQAGQVVQSPMQGLIQFCSIHAL